MKKILNYRIIITLLICTVFVCGVQLAFADSVSAASYKKFDSGKIKSDDMTFKYTSFIKGKNNIYVKLTYENTIIGKFYLNKGKTKVKYIAKSPGQKTKSYSVKHRGKSIKTLYKQFKKDLTIKV